MRIVLNRNIKILFTIFVSILLTNTALSQEVFIERINQYRSVYNLSELKYSEELQEYSDKQLYEIDSKNEIFHSDFDFSWTYLENVAYITCININLDNKFEKFCEKYFKYDITSLYNKDLSDE